MFPFSAIVGQDELKKALILCVIDPMIGGVLVTGDKGTGKTTLVRSISELMQEKGREFPFVNLPLGATEDRVLGSVNLETLIDQKKQVSRPGLLAKAHRGILYIDEINLLSDYLMDVLLDASVSGYYHLEREGVSARFDSRFCLVGTMNPEEGQLRPQLMDRFGLSVEVKTSYDLEEREEITRRRLRYDLDPTGIEKQYEKENKNVRNRIKNAQNLVSGVHISEEAIQYSTQCAVRHQVEGMRADILLLKAARAWAAWQELSEVGKEEIEAVEELVLRHRSRKSDDSPSNENQDEEEQQEDSTLESHVFDSIETDRTLSRISQGASVLTKTKKGQGADATVGRSVRQYQQGSQVDSVKTIEHLVAQQELQVHYRKKEGRSEEGMIVIVDSSASMAKDRMIAQVKGMIENTLSTKSNTSYGLIGLVDGKAEEILSLEKFRTGGQTNMVAGIQMASEMAQQKNWSCVALYIVTDGRFNSGGEDPMQSAIERLNESHKLFDQIEVVDCESGVVRLGLAKRFAEKIGVKYSTWK